MQPIWVFKWKPPEYILYGSIKAKQISVHFRIPKAQAIPIIIKILGTSPTKSSKPYLIISALSSSTSGISFLIFLVRYSQILSITVSSPHPYFWTNDIPLLINNFLVSIYAQKNGTKNLYYIFHSIFCYFYSYNFCFI